MKNAIHTSLLLVSLTLLFSCQGEDSLPVQLPDDHDLITFTASAKQGATRATEGYETYNPAVHPASMGVFGYCNLTANNTTAEPGSEGVTTLYYNSNIVYDTENKKWKHANSADAKYWPDYAWSQTFDFVAYMPYHANAEGEAAAPAASFVKTGEADQFLLSFPVTLTKSLDSNDPCPVVTDTRQAPAISNAPVNMTAAGEQVHLLFDQTLTGYRLRFRLDATMGAIRHFRISSVTLSGDALPFSGIVSRTYKKNEAGWTSGDVTWAAENIKTQHFDSFHLAYQNNGEADQCYDDTGKTLVVMSDNARQWGPLFYAIPAATFTPAISVTYDAELVDENGNDVKTRENITSTIVLNKTNFKNLTSRAGSISTIDILIQPRYLYVISDEDKYTGHLLIE